MTDESSPTAGLDLLAAGLLFLDVVLAELPHAPMPGREVWTAASGTSPGGAANFAVAGARLGLRTGLAATIGDDPVGGLCRTLLEAEGVDLAGCAVRPGWSTPVTAALSWDGDRALVTGGVPDPTTADELLDRPIPSSRLAITHLTPHSGPWVRAAAARGTRVIGDVGWETAARPDPAVLAQLADCHAFVPNEPEALACAPGSDDARAAARRLAELVPLAVVTRGVDGVVAVDATTGEEAERASLPVAAVDTTGAGDVFGAALALGLLHEWSLAQRLDTALLVAGLTVAAPGGAATAPTLAHAAAWVLEHPRAAGPPARWSHLLDLLPSPVPA